MEFSDLKVGNIENIIEEIYKQEPCCLDLTKVNLDKINYYVVKIFINDQTIYLFRRFNKQKKIKKRYKRKIKGSLFLLFSLDLVELAKRVKHKTTC
ncbi:hypothetical protein [Enterococcus ratti]|uniref:hypothetical protein n=1 Tax=Enterococcus ratti TaxID=150033 RepID=UPI0008FFFF33|nr:hypothetical protein [Enterococcus ratti]